MNAQRFRLAPLATASSWPTLWQSLWTAAKRARNCNTVPRLSNREAVAVATAFRGVAPQSFPLWHQFAAAAYAWDPDVVPTELDTSNAQASRMYPDELAAELWTATKRIAHELSATDKPARLELDADDFGDVVVQGAVRDALIADSGPERLSVKPRARPAVELGVTRPSSSSTPRSQGSQLLLAGLALGGLWLAFGRRKPKPRRARVARRTTARRARYAAT